MAPEDKRLEKLENRQSTVESSIVGIGRDIGYIKDQLDNHIITAIAGVCKDVKNLGSGLKTLENQVSTNSKWVLFLLKALLTVAIMGVLGGMVSVVFYIVKLCLSG